MPKNAKTILIIISCILIVLVASLLTFVGITFYSEIQKNQDRQELEQTASIYAETHLKNKYPEQNFIITDVDIDELYNGFTHGGWDDNVTVSVKTNTNSYIVLVDTSKTENNCSDNVQAYEIKKAIIEKIKNIADITPTPQYEIDLFDVPYDIGFYEKYNNDIVDFLQKENLHYKNGLELHIYASYADGIETFTLNEEDKEFLNTIDLVAFINFKQSIPSKLYKYHTAEEIINVCSERNLSLNAMYAYDKSTQEIKDYTNQGFTENISEGESSNALNS